MPTIDEAGVSGYIRADWYGLWFPAGTPVECVVRINAEIVKMLRDDAIKKLFTEQGLIPVASTPEEFGKTIVDEIAFQRQLVAQMGLKTQ